MFCIPLRTRKQKNQDNVGAGGEKIPWKSIQKALAQGNVVPDTAATSAATVSPPTETHRKKAKKASWWRRWPFFKKNSKVRPKNEDGAEGTVLTSSDPEQSNVRIEEYNYDEDGVQEEVAAERDLPVSRQSTPAGHGGSQGALSSNSAVWETVYRCLSKPFPTCTNVLSKCQLDCLGLPNLNQTCYMNSTLQALLTLTCFTEEIHSQLQLWSFLPGCQLISLFADVGLCRLDDSWDKITALTAFKDTVAEFNPEFADDNQKDAHEFLTSVLSMLKYLTSEIHTAAAVLDIPYICPVSAHIGFQMFSRKTCKGCGFQLFGQEDHLYLSLDLVHGGSVSQCLHNYLKGGLLEYKCQCGADKLTEELSFLNLPNVLILQLKRFTFTPSFKLKKVNSPIDLSQELTLNQDSIFSEQGTARYSLVSIVSHLGFSAYSGHYICDGVHRSNEQDDVIDCWLTYDDEDISKTTCASVCDQRQRTAYLLFYEKQP